MSVELRAASGEAGVSLWVLAPGAGDAIEVTCGRASVCAGADCDARLQLHCEGEAQCRCAA